MGLYLRERSDLLFEADDPPVQLFDRVEGPLDRPYVVRAI
jgi:hypothetical protein